MSISLSQRNRKSNLSGVYRLAIDYSDGSISERTSFQPDNTSNVEIDDQTIIIKCLLEYLKMDGLNVREELILTFYALSNWGFDIANKSDFLASCLPAITPA
jgi:hypothetical protein